MRGNQSKGKILILISSSMRLLHVFLNSPALVTGDKKQWPWVYYSGRSTYFLVLFHLLACFSWEHSGERLYRCVYSAFRLSCQPSQGLFLTFWHRNQVIFQLSRQYSKFTSTTPGFLFHCPINLLSTIYPVIPSSFHCPTLRDPSLQPPPASLLLPPEVLVPDPKPD